MDDAKQGRQAIELKEEIIRLGPWHLNVQVTPDISTSVFLEAPEGTYPPSSSPSFMYPRNNFVNTMHMIYPEGLEGRTFLDCACNCGGYSFWAKEIGASECFGFDVREHWINQAHFLAENRQWPADGLRFEMLDLYDLPKLGLEPFDVTNFKGIFYHLPDPITGLKAAADITREVIIVDTVVRTDLPDGMLAVDQESRERLMSGVYGMNWYPTGPDVMARILRWLGFAEIRLVSWRAQPKNTPIRRTQPKDMPINHGRMRIIASREEGLLGEFESQERLALSEIESHTPQLQVDTVTRPRKGWLHTVRRKLRL